MCLSYSSPEGPAAQTGHRWLLTSLCLSLALHGLLAFVHSRSPTSSVQSPSSPPAPRLMVELLHARQTGPHQSSSNAAVLPETFVPSQTRSQRAYMKSDRHVPNDRQAPSRAGISDAYSDAGSASASPSIDIDAARASARQTARAQSASMTRTAQDATDATEPESVLGRKIGRSVHPDCRTSYAGAGLLAIPLLLKDAVSDGGCKW
jgi:hypothetical protein